jgi:hypothetical protein
LAAGQRRTVVRTRIVDRKDLSIDVEDDDAGSIDKDELSLPRTQFVNRCDWDTT